MLLPMLTLIRRFLLQACALQLELKSSIFPVRLRELGFHLLNIEILLLQLLSVVCHVLLQVRARYHAFGEYVYELLSKSGSFRFLKVFHIFDAPLDEVFDALRGSSS